MYIYLHLHMYICTCKHIHMYMCICIKKCMLAIYMHMDVCGHIATYAETHQHTKLYNMHEYAHT